MLDVNFGEDGSQVRKDNAPQNLSLLKKIVLNLIRSDTTDKVKTSLRQKRKRAAWDAISECACWASARYDVRVRKPCPLKLGNVRVTIWRVPVRRPFTHPEAVVFIPK